MEVAIVTVPGNTPAALPSLPARKLFANILGPFSVSNTTAETVLGPATTIPAGLLTVGSVLRVKRYGFWSTNIVAPLIQAKTKFNTTTMLTSGSMTAVASVSSLGWFSESMFTVTSVGTSGTIEANGHMGFATAVGVAIPIIPTNTNSFTIDTTIDQVFSDTVIWSAASPNNIVTVRQMIIELIG